MLVTIEDFLPLPRHDALPFTQARIEESASPDGPWVAIETVALNPVDEDPANPQPRSFTTEEGTIEKGWYQVVFLDADGDFVTVGPVQNVEDERDYLPSIGDVGDLLRARTKDDSGNELGTFTDDTRPTAEQVSSIIKRAGGTVSLTIGDVIPDILEEEAKNAVSLLAAMVIELSFFPEQVAAGRSPYAQYKELYDTLIGTPEEPGTLVLAVRNADDDSVDVSSPHRAVANFTPIQRMIW